MIFGTHAFDSACKRFLSEQSQCVLDYLVSIGAGRCLALGLRRGFYALGGSVWSFWLGMGWDGWGFVFEGYLRRKVSLVGKRAQSSIAGKISFTLGQLYARPISTSF